MDFIWGASVQSCIYNIARLCSVVLRIVSVLHSDVLFCGVYLFILKECPFDAEDRDDFSTPADDDGKQKLRREEEEKKLR